MIMNKKDTNKIIKIGWVFCNTQGGSVFNIEGISPCVSACTHGWANGYILVEDDSNEDSSR